MRMALPDLEDCQGSRWGAYAYANANAATRCRGLDPTICIHSSAHANLTKQAGYTIRGKGDRLDSWNKGLGTPYFLLTTIVYCIRLPQPGTPFLCLATTISCTEISFPGIYACATSCRCILGSFLMEQNLFVSLMGFLHNLEQEGAGQQRQQ